MPSANKTPNYNLTQYSNNGSDKISALQDYNEDMSKIDAALNDNANNIITKANASDVTSALATKSDAAETTAALATKVDESDIVKMLAGEVNVIEFGADPTFTTDSTSAIKNAIAKAVDDSKWEKDGDIITNPTVIIPAGHYIITDTIEIPFFIHIATRGNVIIEWKGEDSNKAAFWINQYFSHDIGPAYTKIRSRILDGTNGRLIIFTSVPYGNKVVGIEVGDRSNVSSQPGVCLYEITGVSVYGFYTGVGMNTYNHYLGYYENVVSGWNFYAFRWGKDGSNDSINSGENTTFVNCALGTSHFGFSFETSGFEGTFVGCSFDFDTESVFNFNNAKYTYLNIHGGHVESQYFTKAIGGETNRISVYGTHFWWVGIDDNYFSKNDSLLINAHDAVFSIYPNATLGHKLPALTTAKVITSGSYSDSVVSMFENKLNNSAFNSSQDTDKVTADILTNTILNEATFIEDPAYSVKLVSHPTINEPTHYQSSGKYLSLQRISNTNSNPFYNIKFKSIKTYGKRLFNFGFMMALNTSQFPSKDSLVLHCIAKDVNGGDINHQTRWTLTDLSAYNPGDCIGVSYTQVQIPAGTDSIAVYIEMLNINDTNQIRYISDFCLSLQ